MNFENYVEKFVGRVVDGNSEKVELTQSVINYCKKLPNSIDYYAIHLRHPILKESRESLSVPKKKSICQTRNHLKAILGLKTISEENIKKFHVALMPIYFSLIGRADSLSDATLRALSSF